METFTGLALLNIIALDIVLSGDNALVIGMAVRRLPAHLARRAAIAAAALAIALRVAFTAAATVLFGVPLLQAAGGAMLLVVAAQLARGDAGGDEADVTSSSTYWAAVKTIVAADVVLSLDNVLAVAGAAHGNLALLLLGLAISIPFVLGGSALVSSALQRWPMLSLAGAVILAATAGQMIAGDRLVAAAMTGAGLSTLAWAAPAIAAGTVVLFAEMRRQSAASIRPLKRS